MLQDLRRDKEERAMRRHVRFQHTHDYKRNEPLLRYVSDHAELETLRSRDSRAAGSET